MTILKILSVLGLSLLTAGVAYVVFLVIGYMGHYALEYVNKFVHYCLDIKAKNQQIKLNSVRVLRPDEHGMSGIVFDGVTYHNMDTGESFDILRTQYLDPIRTQLADMQRLLLAASNLPQVQQNIISEQLPGVMQSAQLPERLTLQDGLSRYGIKPSIDNMFLGVTVDNDTGELVPVTASMQEMVHMLVSGASGWGKSTLLEAMAKQSVMAGDCDICFVDYGVNTFGMLSDYAMYPIASDVEEAISMFSMLIEEGRRRKELMRKYPMAKTIDDYNHLSGDELRPIMCYVDESATLLGDDRTKEPMIELAQMARKFGVWLVMGGTDFKATTIPSSCTGNFGARLGFHLMPGLSRSLLNTADAFGLKDKGRALALLPGQQMQEIQCPIVMTWDNMPEKKAQEPLKLSKTKQAQFDDYVKATCDELMAKQGKVTKSDIARALGMSTGGSDWNKICSALGRLGIDL